MKYKIHSFDTEANNHILVEADKYDSNTFDVEDMLPIDVIVSGELEYFAMEQVSEYYDYCQSLVGLYINIEHLSPCFKVNNDNPYCYIAMGIFIHN